MTIVSLHDAASEAQFGGKASSLHQAIRAGLPVPAGFALATAFVDRIGTADPEAIGAVERYPFPEVSFAVRSSAIGEDTADASFAGQHLTLLNIRRAALVPAIQEVWRSAHSASALAYRARRGLPAEPRIAVVVQTLVQAVSAGVLFTRNPMTQAREIVIEASWGLGEAVVSGLVTPDHYRLAREGGLLELVAGRKDVKIGYWPDGGTREEPVAAELHTVPCLQPDDLSRLRAIAEQCEAQYGPDLDLEWAMAEDRQIYLLQCRPISTATGGGT